MSQTHPRTAKTNGAPQASLATHRPETPRASRQRTKREVAKLAPFAPAEIPASGAPMWPVHPVVWFHPEIKPRLPDSSGLTIESYRKLPAPDFLPLEVTPADRPHSADEVCDPPLPDVKHQLPKSGLAPSGWDPRVAVLHPGGQHRAATVRERTQASGMAGEAPLAADHRNEERNKE